MGLRFCNEVVIAAEQIYPTQLEVACGTASKPLVNDQVRVRLGQGRGSGRAVASMPEGSDLVIGNFTTLLTVNFENFKSQMWPRLAHFKDILCYLVSDYVR